jgi:hypothetical protein
VEDSLYGWIASRLDPTDQVAVIRLLQRLVAGGDAAAAIAAPRLPIPRRFPNRFAAIA